MKKILIFGIAIMASAMIFAQPVIPHRGKIMQVYGGDTLQIEFADDAVNLVTNTGGISVNGGSAMVGFEMDSIVFDAVTDDTLYFPTLPVDYLYNVTFNLVADSLDEADVTINFQQTYAADSTYIGVNDSAFPFELYAEPYEYNFIGVAALKYQRAIIAWPAEVELKGTIIIYRKKEY